MTMKMITNFMRMVAIAFLTMIVGIILAGLGGFVLVTFPPGFVVYLLCLIVGASVLLKDMGER